MSRPAALELSGIVRRWGPRAVLDGVELRLERGARGFLGGRNGAGKTTLVRIVAGVLAPHAGRVAIEGLDPASDRRAYQRRLGYLPAGNGGLYARLTVRQNLEFWAALALLGPAGAEAAVQRSLERFELADLERSRCDRISMGQRQRARLAATFLHDPALVLLDEPHTSLDDDALSLLRAALDDHHARGGATLWCAPSDRQADLGAADVRFTIDAGQAHAS